MSPEAATALSHVDAWILAILPWIAIWLLISGVDDLVVDVMFLARWWRQRGATHTPVPLGLVEKKIAIFVPLWKEHQVIAQMLDHNLRVIQYGNYEFFVGAYPNDDDTLSVMRDVASKKPQVHLCICPHDGPTSKADCLNWILQHMLLHEQETGKEFDAIMLHDAEDVIHPESLRLVNRGLDDHAMVQIPVVPLATPARDWTHAVYCDEFAESQWKDLRARVYGGGFLPSCGVGTALSRECVSLLAEKYSNRVFDPECLTEDYEIGMRVHRLGLSQIFTSLEGARAVATREFFPQSIRGAVRQRTRWITGISLQSWERNGWGSNPGVWYWLWRDRKGLVGNPLSVLANLIFLYGLATWVIAALSNTSWGLDGHVSQLAWIAAIFQVERMATRGFCCAQIYGFGFAKWVPLRVFWANLLNTLATLSAIHRFFQARVRKQPLVWLKTEHAYPSMATLEEAAIMAEQRAQLALEE